VRRDAHATRDRGRTLSVLWPDRSHLLSLRVASFVALRQSHPIGNDSDPLAGDCLSILYHPVTILVSNHCTRTEWISIGNCSCALCVTISKHRPTRKPAVQAVMRPNSDPSNLPASDDLESDADRSVVAPRLSCVLAKEPPVTTRGRLMRSESLPADPTPACENCGGFVTANYVRVSAPIDPGTVRVCSQCENKVRDEAEVRETRSPRRSR